MLAKSKLSNIQTITLKQYHTQIFQKTTIWFLMMN